MNDALDAELKAAKAVAGIAAASSVTYPRLETYARLQKEKNDLDAKISSIVAVNEEFAKDVGALRTSIGVAGVAAGITATALIAASPANAVWVAAFAGFAGGVAGMNTVFDNNGYSREQVAGLETAVIQRYAAASKALRLGVLFEIANDPTSTPAAWIKELETQEQALAELRALALTLKVPLGPPKTP